jgi:hypothetical protein
MQSPLAVFILLFLSAITPVSAQALADRIGRVAAVNGAAQLWDSQDRQWTPLFANRVVTAGDRIRSDGQTRVELSIGSLELFLGPQSELDVLRLDAQATQVRLNQGHLVARVRTAEWARELQLITAEFNAQPASPGLYRLDRDTVSGGRSAAASLRGLLLLGAVDARLQVAAGQRIEVMGAEAGGGLRSTTLLQDGFAAWVAARDQAPEPNPFAAVAPLGEITGLETLERHGRWESHPDVGWVWYPMTVRPGWEPFRDGRWVWVRPWGWTWVDDAPWGFAPSHYGRWLQWNNRWVWSPGSVRNRVGPPAGMPVIPPTGALPPARPRDELPPGQWPGDHENRSVRTPRVDPWNPGPGRPPIPSGGAILPGVGDDRAARPDRRHGFERPQDRLQERLQEQRPVERPTDRLSPAVRSDHPDPSRAKPPTERERTDKPDRPDRPDRQRQLAQ